MWGADWKFRHSGNCSASRGLPSDAEQLPEWRSFQFAPKNHYGFFFLRTLHSTIAFRFEYVLFYQFYARITTFFDQEKFGTAPLLYVDVETFGGNWRENDVKTSNVKTSKSSYWRLARESSYTPHVKRHFLAPVGFTEISVGSARKGFYWGTTAENLHRWSPASPFAWLQLFCFYLKGISSIHSSSILSRVSQSLF